MSADQPRILFGWKPEWRAGCMRGARRAGFHATMSPLAAAELGEFDAVIPISLEDHGYIENLKTSREAVRAIYMPRAQRDICDDKLAFARRMAETGHQDYIPRSIDLNSLTANDFPVVVKLRRSAFGRGTFIVADVAALEPHLPRLAMGEAFLQELIPGQEEYAAHLLMDDGLMVFTSVVQYRMPGMNLIKGFQHRPAYKCWLPGTPFRPLWCQVLLGLGIDSGTICIDYRIRDGKPVIFEINPRLGNSLAGNMTSYIQIYKSRVREKWRLGFG